MKPFITLLIVMTLLCITVYFKFFKNDNIPLIDVATLNRVEPTFSVSLQHLKDDEFDHRMVDRARLDIGKEADFYHAVRCPNSGNIVLIFMKRFYTDTYLFYRISNDDILDKCEANAFRL
jgi:hypothetical protein